LVTREAVALVDLALLSLRDIAESARSAVADTISRNGAVDVPWRELGFGVEGCLADATRSPILWHGTTAFEPIHRPDDHENGQQESDSSNCPRSIRSHESSYRRHPRNPMRSAAAIMEII